MSLSEWSFYDVLRLLGVSREEYDQKLESYGRVPRSIRFARLRDQILARHPGKLSDVMRAHLGEFMREMIDREVIFPPEDPFDRMLCRVTTRAPLRDRMVLTEDMNFTGFVEVVSQFSYSSRSPPLTFCSTATLASDADDFPLEEGHYPIANLLRRAIYPFLVSICARFAFEEVPIQTPISTVTVQYWPVELRSLSMLEKIIFHIAGLVEHVKKHRLFARLELPGIETPSQTFDEIAGTVKILLYQIEKELTGVERRHLQTYLYEIVRFSWSHETRCPSIIHFETRMLTNPYVNRTEERFASSFIAPPSIVAAFETFSSILPIIEREDERHNTGLRIDQYRRLLRDVQAVIDLQSEHMSLPNTNESTVVKCLAEIFTEVDGQLTLNSFRSFSI